MGDYTRLELEITLRRDTPRDVVNALNDLIEGDIPNNPPRHPFFSTSSASLIATGKSGSHEHTVPSSLKSENGRYHLRISSSLKDHDDEVENFLDWITAHTDGDLGDVVGYVDHPDSCDTISPLVWNGVEIFEVRREPEGLGDARFGGKWGSPECSYAAFLAVADLSLDGFHVESVRKAAQHAIGCHELPLKEEFLDGPLIRPKMDYVSEFLADSITHMPAFRHNESNDFSPK